jgi:hypothetical protein
LLVAAAHGLPREAPAHATLALVMILLPSEVMVLHVKVLKNVETIVATALDVK